MSEDIEVTECARYYESPVGLLELKASETGLRSLLFKFERDPLLITDTTSEILQQCVAELDTYFAGKLTSFKVPLEMQGTDFQLVVWKELLFIPFGQTISYLQLAKRVGDLHSTRAVGNANGKNPLSIIVPCHRVIGSNGKLVGYGGGMDNKRWLLEFERNLTTRDLFNSMLSDPTHGE
ncbi:MAG: methylated-DNA--[protein]-cysteine S-methyltransferase [Bacteroidia bacterium]